MYGCGYAIDGYPAAGVDLVHQQGIHVIAEVMLVGKGQVKAGDIGKAVQHFGKEQQADTHADLRKVAPFENQKSHQRGE